MSDTVEYTDVPYLQEILNFLPINPDDEEDVLRYVQNITNLIAVNYKYEQYQFAYFGIHLLYMTYIYCTVWKIGQIEPTRYNDAFAFARPYHGKDVKFDADSVESIFTYSWMPESEIANLFKVIGLDESQINIVSGLVGTRNNMAHATGKFIITTEEAFDSNVHSVFISIQNIHRRMDQLIRKWYKEILISFCAGEYDGYDNPKDFIFEQMIQSFKLSTNELLICNEMSVSGLIAAHRGYQSKLKTFKNTVSNYCKEMGYI